MKSNTRLDSVTFQLTPTRTRCDLFIIASEKKEKIASGLLNPFLAHLKTAQDQITRGGYSILLQVEPRTDATWFTKGTVERFVRFVSTPEILERVYTTESEILHIEKAITNQASNDNGLSLIEDQRGKSLESSQGTETMPDNNEKAIVLHEPGTQLSETNDSDKRGEDSRIQLLKVLETRKTVLQKEQGMAFARAVAAGFDIDYMEALMSFAECFGASRLMDACLKFVDLWKRKHETGQWVEFEAAEAMSGRSDFSAMKASGIMLSSVADRHNDSLSRTGSEAGGKAVTDADADERPSMDHQFPASQQDYSQGQFPHPLFPAWPMQSPSGALPVYQPYPMPGMPYYPNYMGNGPLYRPFPPMDGSHLSPGRRTAQERQSVDGKDSYPESEMHEMEKDMCKNKAGRSRRKKSGTVVIRNINYITSKSKSSDIEAVSSSESESEKEGETSSSLDATHQSSSKSLRKRDLANNMGPLVVSDGEEMGDGKEIGHWQAFQDCLLKGADDDNQTSNQSMFAMEKDVQLKRRQSAVGDDTLAVDGQESIDVQDGRITEYLVDGQVCRKLRVLNDEASVSGGHSQYGGRRFAEGEMDMQSMEINGRKIIHRTGNDDFIVTGRENQPDLRKLSDPLALNRLEHSNNEMNKSLEPDMADESFFVPFRSMSIGQSRTDDRIAIDMDSEVHLTQIKSENESDRYVRKVVCEPDDLSLMPERGVEKETIGYDPALDYEIEVRIEDSALLSKSDKELVTGAEQGSMKSGKSNFTPDALDRKKIGGPIRKGKSSKMSPMEDARVRADRLRNYKADLQKMKKEKEEAELKRLGALKMERQKRIAARGGSSQAVQSKSLPQIRKQPSRASKFSDSEPGSLSPLQRSKIRTSLGSNESQKVSKSIESSEGNHMPLNRLSRSVSSLSESIKETSVTPESKASMSRIRRLSEPRTNSQPASLVKMQNTDPKLKTKVSGGSKPKASYRPESKKISALTSLDRSKAATLPELKIKTSRVSSSSDINKSVQIEFHDVNENKPMISEYPKMNINHGQMLHQSDDDNLVIDKTIVTLECEKLSIPAVHALGERMLEKDCHDGSGNVVQNVEKVSEYAPIRAPPSPIDGVTIVPYQPENRCITDEVMDNKEKEPPKVSSIDPFEKTYQAPYARVSSLEDQSTGNLECGSVLSTYMMSTDNEPHASNFEDQIAEKTPEILDKSHVKEPSKGFKRLLKFGKKNQRSSALDRSLDAGNNSEQDGIVKNVSSDEVNTLKNLISEEETPTASHVSQKSSHHLSLFSAFRSKGDKKQIIRV